MGGRTDDFTLVVPGDPVTVTAPGRLVIDGTVDAVAPDGSVLWVVEDGGQGRHMVHRTDAAAVQLR
ncbi:hypothetical protein GCM10012320_15850 [Sinomonas cellulolyticus]|jgi:hypothetical protein|uniref:Uncharacterized protein n=1 Tax=Sinomonas cellulolyticus TaxID=2801916 RepID=A0ABS1JYT9_9MICC|nr:MULTISPECIES: hypothetical protein [Sinomonas]MBL0704410.1 hypothetical protein [Sinomonas cellulolyticus]GHG48515.1 hypothetical protein GCM10012320_15850 [Sinomonas sp. KCTC 49339]